MQAKSWRGHCGLDPSSGCSVLTSDNVGFSSKRHILGSNTLANRTGPPDFLQRFATTEALAQLRGAYASQCIVVCLSKYRLFALRRS